jgi:hypothetical protein
MMNINQALSFTGTLKTGQKTRETNDDADRYLLFATAATLSQSKPDDFSIVSRNKDVYQASGQINEQAALEQMTKLIEDNNIAASAKPALGDKINIVVTENSLKVECKNKFSWQVGQNDTNGIFNKRIGDIYMLLRDIGKVF